MVHTQQITNTHQQIQTLTCVLFCYLSIRPGFGDNLRVLDWILDRCESSDNKHKAVETAIGYLPSKGAIDVKGLDISEDTMNELLKVDHHEWLLECQKNREFLKNFGERLPKGITHQMDELTKRLETKQ